MPCILTRRFTDRPVYFLARVPRRDTRHLGTIPGGLARVDAAQLAARDHAICTEAESIALLGQREGPCDVAQVLVEERDLVQRGRPVSCLDHQLSACQCFVSLFFPFFRTAVEERQNS